jgi:hypothetical protein
LHPEWIKRSYASGDKPNGWAGQPASKQPHSKDAAGRNDGKSDPMGISGLDPNEVKCGENEWEHWGMFRSGHEKALS